MTVCLAAISEGSIICLTDRMMLVDEPDVTIRHEPARSKLVKMTNSVAIMWAGNLSIGTELIQATLEALGQMAAEDVSVVGIGQIWSRLVEERRRVEIDTVLLAPLRATCEALAPLAADALERLTVDTYRKAQEHGYPDIAVIIAGVDRYGPRILRASCSPKFPLTVTDETTTGWTVIGSGWSRATLHLRGVGQASELSQARTLFNIYAAKRASEIANGVGPATGFFIVSADAVIAMHQGTADAAVAAVDRIDAEIVEVRDRNYQRYEADLATFNPQPSKVK